MILTTGCGGSSATPPPPRTEAQRDSALAGSTVLPGAAGVRGAMRAADTARARNALRDSLAEAP